MSAKKNNDKEDIQRRLAVALGYKVEHDRAPRVLARGRGEIAKGIIETAKKAGVPVREDGDLATLLGRLDVGREIPEELYQVVAEVLAFVYRMNNLYR